MLETVCLTLGPLQTNAYLLADPQTGDAAVIDPAWEGALILSEARKRGWRIGQIWITHPHFDHIGGLAELVRGLDPTPGIALHPDDRFLYDAQGGAALFGFSLPPSPPPSLDLFHGQTLHLGALSRSGFQPDFSEASGGLTFEVRHTPGHTPGHCIFYCAKADVCFCGDLIFRQSVGRTDLPGGSWLALVESIREQVFTLPQETRLLSGHGEETTVGEEKSQNPFVSMG